MYDVSVFIKRIPRLGRWGSAIMSHAGREEREGGRREGKKKKGGGQRAMEKDRVRVMETGSEPETRPQKSNYRSSREGVGPAPRRIVSNSTKPCQTYTHKHTHKRKNKNF